eukprot:gnl/TRDRNA2_/TRDRNA2_176315_c0_seq14.p1 gnl/TRDRNA2_/TRDRNA2_176315_c0~~gnl/TRDRNA2_/TRDRNA2_176315_c0_seq14.p1  ORF type:complete len:332 (+),score=-9.47 gnl/TRDRNA2_/TRDRNA2_176315_c0_seq14:40-1035(+)
MALRTFLSPKHITRQKKQILIPSSFQRAADGGGIASASNWQIINDKRNWTHVLNHYINKGLVFADPRRPDLIEFYVQEMTRKKHKQKEPTIIKIKKIGLNRKLFSNDCIDQNKNCLKSYKRLITPEYYRLRLASRDFLIPYSKRGLDLSCVSYKEEGSSEIKKVVASNKSTENGKYYHEIEITNTAPGEILQEKEPIVTVTLMYFVRIKNESPHYELDFNDIVCLDGKRISIEKCQIKKMHPTIKVPLLRLFPDGRVLLDDDMFAPSFFQLNEKWWAKKDIEQDVIKRAKRTNRFIFLTLHRGMQTDLMDWCGYNIGIGMEEFFQGGDFAR